MEAYTVHRPREDAIRRILDRHPYDAVGMILRLAWLAGLLRSEIVSLRWDDVDFLNQEIHLPDRSVPLSPELEAYLARMSERGNWGSDFVLLSDRLHKPMQPQPVSHLARRELDAEGETEVRLIDLRHDFIIRQLQEHDWQYVSRITGVEAVTLNLHFAAWIPAGKVSTRIQAEGPPPLDELRLQRLLQEEGTSAAGLALQLTWQAGLTVEEIAALTWEQADLEGRTLDLGGRQVPLTDGLVQLLLPLRASAPGGGPVVRAPRSGTAMRPDRLSRVARAALVRAGLDNLSLRDLRQDYALRAGGETQVLRYVQQHGCITRNEMAELFGISRPTAYRRLAALTDRGRLTRVGTRYYAPQAVVPPEEQYQAIRAYLQAEGPAYRQDIARVLHLEPRQCGQVLKRLVDDGKLTRENYRYTVREA